MIGRLKMSKTVAIYLEFDHDDVDDAEVYNYLNELMENGILNWETENEQHARKL
jgi:hypothetical protein